MQTVLITGGTGLVGKALIEVLLQKGYKVIVLSRQLNNQSANSNVSYALWNIESGHIDVAAVQRADYIIHLAGAGVVDHRWTNSYKSLIQSSRTQSSKLIVDALTKNPNKVKAVISASAIGWYGADKPGGKPFVETDTVAAGFLGDTCKLWEQSIEPVEQLGKRLVKLRLGIVLSNAGGALNEFKKPLKLGVAAILGNGRQMVSWIHIVDLCNLFVHAIENESLSGSYNAVAPFPVNNQTLTLALAKQLNGKLYIPVHVPSFVLKLMMGESSIEVLKSTFVSSEKIQQAGGAFLYPTIDKALQQLFPKKQG